MLLPNQDLLAAYQRFDINGSVTLHPRVRWYVTLANAFDKDYQPATGYVALPRTVRTGLTVPLGGDR
jgi:outer membrane cobalamin receptor